MVPLRKLIAVSATLAWTVFTCARAEAQDSLFGLKAVDGSPLLRLPKVRKDLRLSRGQVLRVIARDQAADAMIDASSSSLKVSDLLALTKKQDEVREKAVIERLSDKHKNQLAHIPAQPPAPPLLPRSDSAHGLTRTATHTRNLY